MEGGIGQERGNHYFPSNAANMDLQSREVGEAAFTEDEVTESRLSKLVPYGLLSSSSFHMLALRGVHNNAINEPTINIDRSGACRDSSGDNANNKNNQAAGEVRWGGGGREDA